MGCYHFHSKEIRVGIIFETDLAGFSIIFETDLMEVGFISFEIDLVRVGINFEVDLGGKGVVLLFNNRFLKEDGRHFLTVCG